MFTVNPLNTEFQINTDAQGDQLSPAVAALAGGGFVVIWVNNVQDASISNLRGQIFDSSTKKIGNEFGIGNPVKRNHNKDQLLPAVAALAGGGFVVIWVGSQFLENNVIGQIYDAAGRKIGSELKIGTSIEPDWLTSVATSKDSWFGVDSMECNYRFLDVEFAVAWTSKPKDRDREAFVQSYHSNGSKINDAKTLGDYSYDIKYSYNIENNNFQPSVIISTTGNVIVIWARGNYKKTVITQGDYSHDILSKVFEDDKPSHPSASPLMFGGFVTIWNANNGSISGLIDHDNYGDNKDRFQIDAHIATNFSASVATLLYDYFVVVWSGDIHNKNYYDIYGQIFDHHGREVNERFLVNTYRKNEQLTPSVATLENEEFVIVWASEGQDGSGYGIYGRVYQRTEYNVCHDRKYCERLAVRAISNNCSSLMRSLLEHNVGANVSADIRDEDGMLTLERLFSYEYNKYYHISDLTNVTDSSIGRLLSHGASPDVTAANGYTLLMNHAKNCTVVKVKSLLSFGAKANITDEWGDNATIRAIHTLDQRKYDSVIARKNCEEVIKMLEATIVTQTDNLTETNDTQQQNQQSEAEVIQIVAESGVFCNYLGLWC